MTPDARLPVHAVNTPATAVVSLDADGHAPAAAVGAAIPDEALIARQLHPVAPAACSDHDHSRDVVRRHAREEPAREKEQLCQPEPIDAARAFADVAQGQAQRSVGTPDEV